MHFCPTCPLMQFYKIWYLKRINIRLRWQWRLWLSGWGTGQMQLETLLTLLWWKRLRECYRNKWGYDIFTELIHSFMQPLGLWILPLCWSYSCLHGNLYLDVSELQVSCSLCWEKKEFMWLFQIRWLYKFRKWKIKRGGGEVWGK